MKKTEMQWDYIKCEREMIDFCLERLGNCIVREYYEYGSYKPTNADRLLDFKLKHMIDHKKALSYTYVKCIVEFLLQNGYKVKCLDYQNDDIILHLLGMIGKDDESIEEYINKINLMEEVKESEDSIGAPFLCIPRSIYNKVCVKIENVYDKFIVRTLNTNKDKCYVCCIIPREDLYSKEYRFMGEDTTNEKFRKNEVNIGNTIIFEIIDD